MDKRKSSVFLASFLIISSMTVAFATWDKGSSILKIGSDRSNSDTYFGELNEYSVGNVELELGSIKEIEVNWHRGEVEISEYEGDKILISENANEPLSKEDKLIYLSKNGKLIVRSSKKLDDEKNEVSIEKQLSIRIPKKNSALINEVKLSTVKSKILVDAEHVSKLKIDSSNGDINLLGRYDKIEMSNVSGNFEAELLNCPQNIDVNAVNGNVILNMPENKGFVLEHDIKNGNFECEFPLTAKENYAIYKKAKSYINIAIINGNIKIIKQK